MTIVGTDRIELDTIEISSVGTGVFDGWVEICEIPLADMPVASATAEVAFFGFAQFGRIEGTLLPSTATIELTIGQTGDPFIFETFRVPLSSSLYYENGNPLRGMTASWAIVYKLAHAISWRRGMDTTIRSPRLFARIATNGAPASSVSASFRVGARGLVVFSLDRLGATDWVDGSYRPPQGQNLNGSPNPPSPGSSRTFHLSSFTGIFDGADDWIVFGAATVWPNWSPAHVGTGIPWYRMRLDKGGAGTTFEEILGRDRLWAMHPLVPAGTGGFGGQGARHQQATGGFGIISSPEDFDQIRFEGVDRNPSGDTSAVRGFEWFAIRSSALGFFRSLQKDFGGGSLFPMLNDYDAAVLSYEPAEWSRPTFASAVLLLTAKWFRRGVGGFSGDLAHLLWIRTNASAATSRGFSLLSPMAVPTRYVNEGREMILGARIENLRPNEVQFQFLGLSNPLDAPPGTGSNRYPTDFAAATWIWENDPDYVPSTVPAVPPATTLVPGREAIDIGSISALSVEPERDSIVERPDRKLAEFVSDDGTRSRWPSWLTVRREFDLAWNGLSVAEKDALLDELRGFVKWTPPFRSAPIALLALGVPDVVDLGRAKYAVRATLVELVWLGSGP